MTVEGNLRKMSTSLRDGLAQYALRLSDILEPMDEIPLNEFVGSEVSFEFTGDINCRVTGQKIKKTFGEGLSYKAFMESPMAAPSIIRPELSRIHEGIALRDEAWEREHHLQPHIVYLSLTSEVKVGVTRKTNVPYRWIDQGATEAIPIAEVPYRQAAGLIEVALKSRLSDKTNWRHMLMDVRNSAMSLEECRSEVLELFPEEWKDHFLPDEEKTVIEYPVLRHPVKVKSIKLDKFPEVRKKLVGIKGQYLLFGDDTVMNIRSHSAYRVRFSV